MEIVYKFSKEGYKQAKADALLVNQLKNHFRKYGRYYLTGITFSILSLDFSGISSVAFAASLTGLNAGGMSIYWKIIALAKWILIVKGTFEAIQTAIDGETAKAKEIFIKYCLCFIVMLAFPYAFSEIEGAFKGGL